MRARTADQDIELQEFNKKQERKKATANNQIASAAVTTVESLDLAAIYVSFLVPFLHKFVEEIGKYFMFPFVAGATLVQAGLAIRQAYIDGGKTRSVVHAGVETAAAAAITTAVVGALSAPAIFVGTVTPLIFAATIAAKTLYHAGAALYYLGKSSMAPTPEKREKYSQLAKGNAITAVAGVAATAAVACVFYFGIFAVATLGVAVSLFVAGYAIYRGVKAIKAAREPQAIMSTADLVDENVVTTSPINTLGISKELGATSANDLRRSSDAIERSTDKSSAAPSETESATLLVQPTDTSKKVDSAPVTNIKKTM